MTFGLYGGNKLFQYTQQVIKQVFFRGRENGPGNITKLETFFSYIHDIIRVDIIRDFWNVF